MPALAPNSEDTYRCDLCGWAGTFDERARHIPVELLIGAAREGIDRRRGEFSPKYDNRSSSAYGYPCDPDAWDNPHVLLWWTAAHDEVILKHMGLSGWAWYMAPSLVPDLLALSTPDVLERWRMTDPRFIMYDYAVDPVWRVLIEFCVSRAKHQHLTDSLRRPKWRLCPMCYHPFIEDSVPETIVRRLGQEQIDFCSPCVSHVLLPGFANPRSDLSRAEVLTYVREVTALIQRVPRQNYGEGLDDVLGLSTEERLRLFRLLQNRPTVALVKQYFGSWLHALIEAGVLEGGAERAGRGTRCFAKDGHLCFSLVEKTIDDFLVEHQMPHVKEPPYPEGNMRADFLVNGAYVEYFGLAGKSDYDARVRIKRALCRKHGIHLVALYPKDVTSPNALARALLPPTKAAPLDHAVPPLSGQHVHVEEPGRAATEAPSLLHRLGQWTYLAIRAIRNPRKRK